MDHQKGNQALMRKLTLERIVTVKAAIWNWQVSKERMAQENPTKLTPRWNEIMKETWAAEKTVIDTLACSMTRCQALVEGNALLSDYYDMATGQPLKVGA
jgi:hypothetical protein